MRHKSYRIIDGKRRIVIVEDGKIVNRDPSKEELKGLEGDVTKKQLYVNNEYLLGCLRQFYNENGRVPMAKDFNNNSKYPNYGTYQNHFGSWNNAIEMAGLWDNRITIRITNEELLEYLKQFYRENGRNPVADDFRNNPRYPSVSIYITRFGSWQKALKLVELDIDSMIIKGVVEKQKGRIFELYILRHFKNISTDLSGENCQSPYDGICPKCQTYDAKSAALIDDRYWMFRLDNTCRDMIEWFYLGAFDKDYRKLIYVWRIPGNFVDKDHLYVGIGNSYEYNLENMKEYEITEKFKNIGMFK